jgi:hypothetical protein
MNPEQDENDYKRNFDARVAELKAGLERLLEPHAELGSGALIVALLELATGCGFLKAVECGRESPWS